MCSDIALPPRKLIVIQYNAKLYYKVDRVEERTHGGAPRREVRGGVEFRHCSGYTEL